MRAGRPGMRPRIGEVDVLRGVALFGISIVNTVGITGMPDGSGLAYSAYETLLHQRFFPIFAFLFGVSFGLFLDAAQERTRSPRSAMLARLGFLMPFGALHRLLQPEEVLLTYAVVGIVVLLPASFLPGRFVLALGAVSTVAAALVTGGSALIPGLFLLGYAAQRFGIERLLALPVRRVAVAFVIGLAAAVALNLWQISGGSQAALAGVVTGATYMAAILLLLRSRVRRALWRLAPLGRMSLTAYIGGTLMIVAAGNFTNLGGTSAVSVGVCVFAVELAFSSLWLRHARYGPLEWVWRCLTWWEVVPNRSTAGARRRTGLRPLGAGRPGHGRPPPARGRP